MRSAFFFVCVSGLHIYIYIYIYRVVMRRALFFFFYFLCVVLFFLCADMLAMHSAFFFVREWIADIYIRHIYYILIVWSCVARCLFFVRGYVGYA